MDTLVKPKLKVALYSRVSTDEQRDHGFSLAAQLELLRKYAADNHYEVSDEYVDGGFSGTTFERPAFQKLLEDAKQQKFQLILVYKVDRLFRNNKALLTISDELEKLGVSIRSITEPFDTSNYLGKFTLSLFGSIAQLERDTLLERSKMGRLRRAREGFYSGTQPTKFGYVYNKETRKLEINEPEAKSVRLIFKLYNQPDSSLVKVGRNLRRLGCKTKEGKNFDSPTLHDVLRDLTYTGTWYANRYSRGGKIKPREQWIEVPVPQIIPQHVFERTQGLLTARRNHSARNAKQKYMLQGLVKCGDCGSTVAGTADKSIQIKNGKKYGPYSRLFYRCTHFVKNRFEKLVSCRMRYVRSELLESLVWKEADRLLLHPEIIETLVEHKEELSERARKDAEQDLLHIDARQQGLLKEEQRILEAYRQSVISIEQLKEQIEKLRVEKEQLEKRKVELREALQHQNHNQELHHAINYLKNIRDGVNKYTLESKKRVLRLLDTAVTVNVSGGVDLLFVLPLTQPSQPAFQSALASASPAFSDDKHPQFLPHFELSKNTCWSSAGLTWGSWRGSWNSACGGLGVPSGLDCSSQGSVSLATVCSPGCRRRCCGRR